jgi:hypothetical protein
MEKRDIFKMFNDAIDNSMIYLAELLVPFGVLGRELDVCEDDRNVVKIECDPGVFKTMEYIRCVDGKFVEFKFLGESDWHELNDFRGDVTSWEYLIDEVENAVFPTPSIIRAQNHAFQYLKEHGGI